MANTFFDSLDAFLRLKRRRLFTASVQATYFAILTEFYLQGFPEEITMTVRELGAKAGLKSSESVHVAKNILKNNGLIDFQTVGRQARRTIFTLVCPVVCSNVCPNNLPNNLPNNESGEGLVCYTATQENGGGETLPLPPTPPIPNPKKTTEAIPPNQFSSIQSEQDEEEDVVELWEKETGLLLKQPADQFVLRHYDDIHGREIIKVAIEQHKYNGGNSFKYFTKCLEDLLARLKGGEETGRDSRGVRVDKRVEGCGRGAESFALGTGTGKDGTGKGKAGTGKDGTGKDGTGYYDNEPERDYSCIRELSERASENRE